MRIVTVQDLTCFGKCALTLALPVLSAMGYETSVLPTALLSTHTGGLGAPHVAPLCAAARETVAHWKRLGLHFDAALIGYLGSVEAIQCARAVMEDCLAPGAPVFCDPAMADGGRLYGGLDENYAREMARFCLSCDVVFPNMTEAAMMTGLPMPQGEGEAAREAVIALAHALRRQGARRVVLKGYPQRGQCLMDADGSVRFHLVPELPGHYHGTGDLFAAAFCAVYLRTKDMEKSARAASGFVSESIARTQEAGEDERMGVRFEPALASLMKNAENA